MKSTRQTGKLSSLVVEGPILGHWEYSQQMRTRIDQYVRKEMQSSLSAIVNSFVEGQPLDEKQLAAQTSSAHFARFLKHYHQLDEPISWWGRVTLRVGNPFPVNGILARLRLVDGIVRDLDVAVWRRPRPAGPGAPLGGR